MKQFMSMLIAACLISTAALAGNTSKEALIGTYMEARTCDVFTAACFASSEVNMNGKEAIMAWQVTTGSHDGIQLGGLNVVAVVRAKSSLGDTAANPYPALSLIYVDDTASPIQQTALVSLAKEMAPDLLTDVIRVEALPISMVTDKCTADTCGSLKVADIVELELRNLHADDKKCGNDIAFYQPLTKVSMPMAHFTKSEKFLDKGLGITWNDNGRRNAYVATFTK